MKKARSCAPQFVITRYYAASSRIAPRTFSAIDRRPRPGLQTLLQRRT